MKSGRRGNLRDCLNPMIDIATPRLIGIHHDRNYYDERGVSIGVTVVVPWVLPRQYFISTG
jgi:hypothetical protein